MTYTCSMNTFSMKTLLLTLLLLGCVACCSFAQSNIAYVYDSNGNRVQRALRPTPDRTIGLLILPTITYGSTSITLRVRLTEIGGAL